MDDRRPCPDISDCREDSLASQRHTPRICTKRDPFANQNDVRRSDANSFTETKTHVKNVWFLKCQHSQYLYIPKEKKQQETNVHTALNSQPPNMF